MNGTWVDCREFCHIIGRSKAFVCRIAANGYWSDFGIVMLRCHGYFPGPSRLYFLIPQELMSTNPIAAKSAQSLPS
jgi:hypothetical protein